MSAGRAAPADEGLVRVMLDEQPALPWKNGGGVTRELLCWPDAADWHCRISVAEVTRNGPFSAYPGIERAFCVLQGAGVRLFFGSGVRVIVKGDAPLVFDGASAPECELIAGPTLDLNLMVRKDRGNAEMTPVMPGQPWQSAAPLRALFCLHGGQMQVAGGTPQLVPPGGLVFAPASTGAPWQCQAEPHTAWWLAFTPLAR